MNLKDFVHEDDRHKISDLWSRVCRDRQMVTSGDYRFRTIDNSYVILQTIFEPFVNPWNDEIEIIVARNRTKNFSIKSAQTYMPIENDNPCTDDVDSLGTLDSNEFIRQLFP
ncbi:unnamed protein product [Rotaria sordida]|nr:unnamed protein product [Rotaria sordida]